MGYDTRYTLALKTATGQTPPTSFSDEVIKRLRVFSEEAAYVLEEDGSSADCGKWYEHQEEITSFSKCYPSLLFILSGEGAESGDIWTKYFLGGKVQVEKARIIVDPFDPSKLK